MRNIRKRKEKEPRDPDQRQCNSDQVTKKAPPWWHRTEQKDTKRKHYFIFRLDTTVKLGYISFVIKRLMSLF